MGTAINMKEIMGTENNCTRRFWVLEDNFISFLLILSEIINYKLDPVEIDVIKYGLTSTSNEKGLWFEYKLIGTENISLDFSKDSEEREIINIKLTASAELSDKIDLAIYVIDNFKLDPYRFN